MSVQSWYDEFYPLDPIDIPIHEAAEHSLKKWVGMLESNLKKHGINPDTHGDEHGNYLDTACALCEHFQDIQSLNHPCKNCPLVLSGHKDCFHPESTYANKYGFGIEPLIKELEETVEWIKNNPTEFADCISKAQQEQE